jgi:hypothetical protein
MKINILFKGSIIGLGVLGLAVNSAMCDSINQTGTSGTTYTGNDDGQGSANLGREINSATIVNNASDLFITIALTPAANIQTEGDFDYVMDISTGSGGDSTETTAGNPYGRDIDIDSGFGGMNYWIGAFPSGSSPYGSFGFNDYAWSGSAWSLIETVSSGQTISDEPSTSSPNEVTLTVPLSDLGLTAGSSFDFDIDATGSSGAQTAYGALAISGPVQGGTYYNNGTAESASGTYSATYQFNETVLDQYTVAAVPEPANLALGGVACLSVFIRG